ncbi:hypothetical protein Tco_0080371 [Tanacetum coccineum]
MLVEKIDIHKAVSSATMNGKVPDYAERGIRLLWSLSLVVSVYELDRARMMRVKEFAVVLLYWEVQKFDIVSINRNRKVCPRTAHICLESDIICNWVCVPEYYVKRKMFSIIYKPMHGIIYKNSKKEKRVMRHSKIHKFCDATLIRVLEGLKSYNNDVKYGYVQRELTNDEVEYLKLFEEEIEVSQPDEKIGDVCE